MKSSALKCQRPNLTERALASGYQPGRGVRVRRLRPILVSICVSLNLRIPARLSVPSDARRSRPGSGVPVRNASTPVHRALRDSPLSGATQALESAGVNTGLTDTEGTSTVVLGMANGFWQMLAHWTLKIGGGARVSAGNPSRVSLSSKMA